MSQNPNSKKFVQQRIAMEHRSRELAETLRNRRQGLHVEQAPDLLDNQQLAANREFEVARLTSERQELFLVKRALATLNSGAYGMCIECDEAISPKRLAAMPWAVRCISCQQQFEETSSNDESQDWTGWEPPAAA